MKNRATVKSLSLFLSFVFLLFSFPVSVFANDSTAPAEEQITQEQTTDAQETLPETNLTATPSSTALTPKPGDKTIDELQAMTFDAAAMPEFVNMDVAEEKEHVNRLTAQENSLSTVIYQNRDGSKSVYIFSNPVKYIDSSGKIKDKSSKIKAVLNTTYSYAMTDNSTKVFFPKSISDGTHLSFSDTYSIKMTPKNPEASAPVLGNDGKISYNGVFGRNTLLVYETKLNGLKEDIVLVKNIGVNEFEFEVETSLVPTLADGVWYFVNERGVRIASLGDIIIKDSAGNQTVGTITVTSSSSSVKYNVTVTAPSEFLNAETTVYPVYIDPTILEDFTGEVQYDAILDTGLYASEDVKSYAESTPDHHYFSRDYYQGRIIYKFYDFFGEFGAYKNLNSYQISSAKLYFYAEEGVVPDTITARPMTATWNPEEVAINPIALYDPLLWNSYSTLYQSTQTIDATAGVKTINVTNIVKQWARYNNYLTTAAYADPENGLVLSCNTTEFEGREIRSIESSRQSNDVYMILDIGEYGGNYYISNEETGKYLGLIVEWDEMSDLSALELTCGNASTAINNSAYKWIFQYIGLGRYYIYLQSETNYGLGRYFDDKLYACDMTDYDYERIWQIEQMTNGLIIKSVVASRTDKVIYASQNDDFYLSNPSSYTSSDYPGSLMTFTEYKPYSLLTSANISFSDGWVNVGTTVTPTISAFPTSATVKSARHFDWFSRDQAVATVDKDGKITAKKDGIAIITATYRPNPEITLNIYVEIGRMIPDGTYRIANVHSGKYIAVENASTNNGAYIEQATPNSQSEQDWIITFDSSGYYYIKSAKSNKYMTVLGNDIIQTSNITDATRWRFVCTGNGYYKLLPQNAISGYVLSLESSNVGNGANLISKLYVNDSSFIDEWAIILPMSGYELDYDTSLWDGIIENETNCYAYAINNQTDKYGGLWSNCEGSIGGTQNPGSYATAYGELIFYPPPVDLITLKYFTNYLISETIRDFEQFSIDNQSEYIFENVERFEVCPLGTYKVALVISSDDYHWYRQNSDGTWSHKPGITPVTNIDDSERVIYDPSLANWQENYDIFVGYFAVTPWNRYYSGN